MRNAVIALFCFGVLAFLAATDSGLSMWLRAFFGGLGAGCWVIALCLCLCANAAYWDDIDEQAGRGRRS